MIYQSIKITSFKKKHFFLVKNIVNKKKYIFAKYFMSKNKKKGKYFFSNFKVTK